MITPIMQTPILASSYFDINSPKNKKAIMVAKIGDVFEMNASLDREISLTAALNRKNVIVPEIALIITNFH
jgi:hypothetical protein